MLTTTLNAIRAHKPREDKWARLLKYLGKTEADDEPLAFVTILDSNGIDDAIWAMRSAPQYDKDWRLFAAWCARKSLAHIDDWRAVQAVQIAERYAHGMASKEQLAAAGAAAGAAAWDAAGAAAWDAAWVAAEAAAGAAARAAAEAAAEDAAEDAAWVAAWDAAEAAQEARLREIVS